VSQTLLAPEVAPLPHNLEAEQAILGAILFDNSVYSRVSGELTADHFHEPYHAQVYHLAGQMIGDGHLADPTMMIDRLEASNANGGLRYLADLIDRAPPAHVAAQYSRPIIEASTRRRMIELGGALQVVARDPEQEPFTAINAMSDRVEELVSGAAPDDHTLIDARTAAVELVAKLDHMAATGESPGLEIGIDCVDQGLGGLHPNELIILAGRPSMGKTGLARAIAMATARRHPDVLVPFFALEMDREQVSQRNLSALSYEEGTGVWYSRMRKASALSAEDRAHLEQMTRRVPENFILDDTAVLSLDHVRRRLMSLRRRGRIGLAVIDYLQIMELPRFNGMNQTQAIGEMTSGLKQLAKQLACPILLLSQLSRKVEERDNKRPMLSDLRDSGSIEQDASAVMFAYRDAYYIEREGQRKGESVQDFELRLHGCMRDMEVIFGKVRHGAIGTTRQTYIAECDVILNEGRF